MEEASGKSADEHGCEAVRLGKGKESGCGGADKQFEDHPVDGGVADHGHRSYAGGVEHDLERLGDAGFGVGVGLAAHRAVAPVAAQRPPVRNDLKAGAALEVARAQLGESGLDKDRSPDDSAEQPGRLARPQERGTKHAAHAPPPEPARRRDEFGQSGGRGRGIGIAEDHAPVVGERAGVAKEMDDHDREMPATRAPVKRGVRSSEARMIADDLPSEFFVRDRFTERRTLVSSGPLFARGVPPAPLVLVDAASAPLDLSGFDGVSLTARNDAPGRVLLELLVQVGDPSPTRLFTGGRTKIEAGATAAYFFAWSDFGWYGKTPDIARVRRIEAVFRRGKGAPPTPVAVVVLECALRKRVAVRGPRLSEAGLEHLLARPDDFAAKTFPDWTRRSALTRLPTPVFSHPSERPQDVLSGRIMGHAVGFPPDWTADPEGELEWRCFLHRHHFLRRLVCAGRGSAALAVLLDWIENNPIPTQSDGGSGSAWQCLSVAWRLREWIPALAACWSGFDAPGRSMVLRSVWEHARFLLVHRGWPGNWRIVEAASLALAGLVFPEFRESPCWTEIGLARLTEETERQFLGDGTHVERSPLYHGLCLESRLLVVAAAEAAGVAAPKAIRAGLARSVQVFADLVRPDGTLPSLNDSGGVERLARPTLRLAEVLLGSRFAPSRRDCLLPEAGFAVLRRGGDFALLKAGPKPSTHAHEDDASLEIVLAGRPVCLDPGVARYAPSAVAASLRATESHNCLVPSIPMERAAPPVFVGEGRGRVARTSRRGPGLKHVREVGLPKPGVATVVDALHGPTIGPFALYWRFAPGELVLDGEEAVRGEGFILTLDPGGAAWTVEVAAGGVAVAGRIVPAPGLVFRFQPSGPVRIVWRFSVQSSM